MQRGDDGVDEVRLYLASEGCQHKLAEKNNKETMRKIG